MTSEVFEKQEMKYYDLNETLSRGARCSFVMGARSTGKTYAGKKEAIERFIKLGEQFAYVRRWEDEINAVKHSLFDDIAHKYNKQVRCLGQTFQIRDVKPLDLEDVDSRQWERDNPWENFGLALALNKQQNVKGLTAPSVSFVIFDEFIVESENRRYLPNEVAQFVNLLVTIFRDRPRAKIVCFSNTGAVYNPYFSFYKVTTKDLQADFIKRKGGKVLFHMYRNEAASDVLRQGLMGELGNEDYIAYAVDSKFADAHEYMVATRDELFVTKDYYNLVTASGKSFTLHNTQSGDFFIEPGLDKRLKTYALSKSSLDSHNHPYSETLVAELRSRFYYKNIKFSTPDARMEVLHSLNL